VCPSDVQTITTERTEFTSNKPEILEELTTGEQKSEPVVVSSWKTYNTYTYHSNRVSKRGLLCPVISIDCDSCRCYGKFNIKSNLALTRRIINRVWNQFRASKSKSDADNADIFGVQHRQFLHLPVSLFVFKSTLCLCDLKLPQHCCWTLHASRISRRVDWLLVTDILKGFADCILTVVEEKFFPD
jgi:hypothetical protein